MPLSVKRTGKFVVHTDGEPAVVSYRVAQSDHAAEVDIVFELDGLAVERVLAGLDKVCQAPKVVSRCDLIHTAACLVIPIVALRGLCGKRNGVKFNVVVSCGIALGIRLFKAVHLDVIAVKEPVGDVCKAVGNGHGFEIALAGVTVYIVAREAEFGDAERAVSERKARAFGHDGGNILLVAAADIGTEIEICNVAGVDYALEFSRLPKLLVGLLEYGLGEGVRLDVLDAGDIQSLEPARLIERGVVYLLNACGQLELDDAVAQREGGNAYLLHALGHSQLKTVA